MKYYILPKSGKIVEVEAEPYDVLTPCGGFCYTQKKGGFELIESGDWSTKRADLEKKLAERGAAESKAKKAKAGPKKAKAEAKKPEKAAAAKSLAKAKVGKAPGKKRPAADGDSRDAQEAPAFPFGEIDSMEVSPRKDGTFQFLVNGRIFKSPQKKVVVRVPDRPFADAVVADAMVFPSGEMGSFSLLALLSAQLDLVVDSEDNARAYLLGRLEQEYSAIFFVNGPERAMIGNYHSFWEAVFDGKPPKARTPGSFPEQAERRLSNILGALDAAQLTVLMHMATLNLSAGVCLLFKDFLMAMKTLLVLQQEWLMISNGFQPIGRAAKKALRTDLEKMIAFYNSGGAVVGKGRK